MLYGVTPALSASHVLRRSKLYTRNHTQTPKTLYKKITMLHVLKHGDLLAIQIQSY